jgi:hypothetical protein
METPEVITEAIDFDHLLLFHITQLYLLTYCGNQNMLMGKMDGHFSPGFSSLQCWMPQEWLKVRWGTQ